MIIRAHVTKSLFSYRLSGFGGVASDSHGRHPAGGGELYLPRSDFTVTTDLDLVLTLFAVLPRVPAGRRPGRPRHRFLVRRGGWLTRLARNRAGRTECRASRRQ